MVIIQLYCEGLSPILINRMTEEQLEALRTGTRLPRVRDITREQEAAEKVYTNGNGIYGLPGENFYSCLINAGRFFKLEGKTQISTQKSTLLPAFLTLREYFLEFDNGAKWVVDVRKGRNEKGEALCLVRPKFTTWGFWATLEIDESQIREEMVRSLVATAGSRIGLGDFRPAKKGPFGRFVVKEWRRVEKEELTDAEEMKRKRL